MIITSENASEAISRLASKEYLSFDTETTGLRLHHEDRPFALVFNDGDSNYYFNLQLTPSIPVSQVCGPLILKELQRQVFGDANKTLFAHNAKFDLHALLTLGITVECKIHDTWTGALIVNNNFMGYSLEECAERIGLEKSDAVEKYITEHKLWEWETIPGKKKRGKKKYFDKVPFDIISAYACQDAKVAYALGEFQTREIDKTKGDSHEAPLYKVMANEARLIPHLVEMENYGVKIDPKFCSRASTFEMERAKSAAQKFEELSGKKFKASSKLFSEVFTPEKSLWQYTDKGNPSFESDVLQSFKSPLANCVLEYRDAKSKSDFYNGFLYYRDTNDVIHPNFKNAGTASGRFSSSEPNLQNLTSEEDEEQLAQDFVVRRAFVPRPGHIFIMPDYSAMEYRMMLDVAGQMDLIEKVAAGHDVHQAAADLAGISRKSAKTMNFLLLYGGGAGKLAEALGIPLQDAYNLRRQYFAALPKVQEFLRNISDVAARRGWIVNWMGRKSMFPDANFAYKAANYYIQGGCADVMKVAMVNIGDYLKSNKLNSKMVLTIHDELVVEVPYNEIDIVPNMVKNFMETAYPYKRLPMAVEMEWSDVSLADKKKGFPQSIGNIFSS